MHFHLRSAFRVLFGIIPKPTVGKTSLTNASEQIFAELVRPGDTCFDVGANVGDTALFLARRAGSTGCVVAFEPIWPTFARLSARIQADHRRKAPIYAVPCGLSDSNGVLPICVPGDDHPQASLAPRAQWQESHAGIELTEYLAQFVTLDSFIEFNRLASPDFLKVDVEGAELLTFRGASKMLTGKKPPLIFVEIFAPWEKAFGYGPDSVFSMLAECGYRFLFVCPGGLIEYTPTLAKPFPDAYEGGCNVVAFHPSFHGDRISRLADLRVGGGTPLLELDELPMLNRIETVGRSFQEPCR